MAVDAGEELEDLRVVVQHLLEMRHEPHGVGGIAGVAAAQMIIDAAGVHRLEERASGIAEPRVAATEHLVPEEAEDRRVGEFRRTADAAVLGIDGADQGVADPGQVGGRQRIPGGGRGELGQMGGERGGVFGQIAAAGPPGVGDALENLPERRASPARRGRPVGAAVHRPSVGIEEHGQRPAALFAHGVQGAHIDVVDVRTLFAIDFHIDEQTVHPLGYLDVLERTRAPSRGTSGRRRSRPTAGSDSRAVSPRRRSPAPIGASGPGFRHAAAGRERSPRRGGCGRCPSRASPFWAGSLTPPKPPQLVDAVVDRVGRDQRSRQQGPRIVDAVVDRVGRDQRSRQQGPRIVDAVGDRVGRDRRSRQQGPRIVDAVVDRVGRDRRSRLQGPRIVDAVGDRVGRDQRSRQQGPRIVDAVGDRVGRDRRSRQQGPRIVDAVGDRVGRDQRSRLQGPRIVDAVGDRVGAMELQGPRIETRSATASAAISDRGYRGRGL